MTLFVFLLGMPVGAATMMLIDLLTALLPAVFVLVHMQREAEKKKKENK